MTHMTTVQARSFIRLMVARLIGPGYHPDTPMADYTGDDGRRSFSPGEAQVLDLLHGQALAVLEAAGVDPCGVALAESRKRFPEVFR